MYSAKTAVEDAIKKSKATKNAMIGVWREQPGISPNQFTSYSAETIQPAAAAGMMLDVVNLDARLCYIYMLWSGGWNAPTGSSINLYLCRVLFEFVDEMIG